jgi:hypothetical protein
VLGLGLVVGWDRWLATALLQDIQQQQQQEEEEEEEEHQQQQSAVVA